MKEAELTKMRLDQAALVSPVTGIIADDGKTRLPYPDGKKFIVDITLSDAADLTVGMEGEVRIGG